MSHYTAVNQWIGERLDTKEQSAPSQEAIVDPFPSSHAARLGRALIAARARRRAFFKGSLFSDPAWDMLLELFTAESEGRRLAISRVGISANIPLTTALRWLEALRREGLVLRQGDPLDGRRSLLSLTDHGLQMMRQYLDGLDENVVALRVIR